MLDFMELIVSHITNFSFAMKQSIYAKKSQFQNLEMSLLTI